MNKILALIAAFLIGISPAVAATSKLKGNLQVTGNATISGTLTTSGATTVSAVTTTGDASVGDDLAVADDAAVTGDATIGGTLGVTGAVTLTVPLTEANVNNSVKRVPIVFPLVNGTAADSATYTVVIAPGRAGTVTKIATACATAPSGGTHTLTITKGNATTLLSTANVDPTAAFVAHTATPLTLTGAGASLAFTATDVLKVVLANGTQTTDAVAPSVTIEVEFDDF
jgi:hypothetical protein